MEIFLAFFQNIDKKLIKWKNSDKVPQQINEIEMNFNKKQNFLYIITECIDALQLLVVPSS